VCPFKKALCKINIFLFPPCHFSCCIFNNNSSFSCCKIFSILLVLVENNLFSVFNCCIFVSWKTQSLSPSPLRNTKH
jgi:hypothetical protein